MMAGFRDHLTPEQLDLVRRFPAKYTASIVEAIAGELFELSLTDGVILDPFAGVSGIHQFADRYPNLTTLGIDIEPEQAALHPRTVHGNSRHAHELLVELAAAAGGAATSRGPSAGSIDLVFGVDAIVTSPAYGNRLADQYLGSATEKCRPCMGGGWKPRRGHTDKVPDPKDSGYVAAVLALPEEQRSKCAKCSGSGQSPSKRQGYAIALGRTLTGGSGAALPWGPAYRELHEAVVESCAKLVRPGGWWLVNVSSSIASEEYQGVMEWWVGLLARHATIVKLRPIPTPRSRMGANGDARVPVEHLIVARA